MILDERGNPIAATQEPLELVDPIFDSRVESGPYRLPNVRVDNGASPEFKRDLASEIDRARLDGATRFDAAGEQARSVNLDAFSNELTGLGTVWGDKTRGGLMGGPVFCLYRVRGPEAEAMTRGSDLGANIVNKIPDEMTREGYTVEVQPTDGEEDLSGDTHAQLDACLNQPHRAAAAWRRIAHRAPRVDGARLYEVARRWDEFGEQMAQIAANPPRQNVGLTPPPAPPGPLPKLNDEGIEISRAMDKWGEEVSIDKVVNQALRYERMTGGGAIFIGVDDGVIDLTQPLDPKRVKRVTHLTAFTGGWDGEVVMWRPYNDMTHRKYGQPEIYQVRNLSVQLARPPAPGETNPVRQLLPLGPTGPTIRYVHESRFMIFNGDPASRAAQQEQRGWGDSIYTRVKDVLSQFDQTWNAVASLMQEFSIINMAIDGYSTLLASQNPKDKEILLKRARDLQLLRSVARMNIYDAKDKVERMNVSMAGIPELLDGPLARRLAAAADEPVSLLFGQVVGSIGGGAGESERRSFYDSLRSKQNRKVVPQLNHVYDIVFRSSEGPTKGKVPERWSVVPRPLWQSTPSEQADVRLKTAQADEIEIRTGVVDANEVTAKRYGGTEYDPGPIVIDIEGRRQSAELEAERAETRRATAAAQPAPVADPGVPLPNPVIEQTTYQPIPPMRASPADPITGDPVAVPSEVNQTGAGGKPLVQESE